MPIDLSIFQIEPFIRYKPSIDIWVQGTSASAQPEPFRWIAPGIFDFKKIILGWLHVDKGIWEWKTVDDSPHQPSAAFKKGIKMAIYMPAVLPREPVRVLHTCQTGILTFIKNCYDEWESMGDTSKSAEVEITGSTALNCTKGITRVPSYKIHKLTDTPREITNFYQKHNFLPQED